MSVPSLGPEGRQIYEGYEVLSPQKKNVGNGQGLSPRIGQPLGISQRRVSREVISITRSCPSSSNRNGRAPICGRGLRHVLPSSGWTGRAGSSTCPVSGVSARDIRSFQAAKALRALPRQRSSELRPKAFRFGKLSIGLERRLQ